MLTYSLTKLAAVGAIAAAGTALTGVIVGSLEVATIAAIIGVVAAGTKLTAQQRRQEWVKTLQSKSDAESRARETDTHMSI